MKSLNPCADCKEATQWGQAYEIEHEKFWRYRKALIVSCKGNMEKVKELLDSTMNQKKETKCLCLKCNYYSDCWNV